MTSLAVVKGLHILEDRRLGVLTGGPGGAVQQLGLECREEALGHRVIPARAWSTDARDDAVSGELADVGGAEVLTTAIRVVDEAWPRPSGCQRHLQRIGGQF